MRETEEAMLLALKVEKEPGMAVITNTGDAVSKRVQVPLERWKRQVRDSLWIPKKEPEPPTHFQTSDIQAVKG